MVDAQGKEVPQPRRRPTLKYLLAQTFRNMPGPFRAWREEYTLADSDIRTPTRVETATGCFLLIRNHALQQLRGLDPKLFLTHGDSDLSRRALEMGTIVYHPDMVVTHDKQVKSRNLPEIMKRFSEGLHFLNKWGWGSK